MKNQNKKGFTLVELVIVIAVIAILAGVLIGTFATVINRANQSKAVQEWKAVVDEAYVNYVADHHVAPTYVKIEGKTITFSNSSANSAVKLTTEYYPGNEDSTALKKDNSYFVLDSSNNVYLLWLEDGENSTYSVVASNDSFSDATGLYTRSGDAAPYTFTAITNLKKLTLNGVVYYGK